jgi:polyisoprenoid-binding protein YceI
LHGIPARCGTSLLYSPDVYKQGTRGLLAGELTIRGVTQPVTLEAEYLGHAADPWGAHRAVFTAAGTFNREDWGLTWNMPLDGGGLLVSREIRIEIELEAVLQP